MSTAKYLIVAFLLNTCDVSTSEKDDAYNIFQMKLTNIFQEVTRYDKLRTVLHEQIESGFLQEETVNPEDVTTVFAERLRKLLLSYLDDLKAIKDQVTISRENHQYDPDIKPFNYFNDKQNNSVRLELLFSTQIQVNLNQSFGQVPTDIFKDDKAVLNDFAWLQELDPIFQRNYKDKATLLWQYFASENGASKNFPGVNGESIIDLYDPRRRIWYNKAIMSPKDVILAVDMSGSMTGTHLTIARLVVSSLIDTLQQDDYFNVISFNSHVEFLIPCLKNLSEATTVNKRAFKNAIDGLTKPTGVADFPQALRTAFDVLNRGSLSTLSSSNCSKVIMLISDGLAYDDRVDEVLANYNGNKDVIIFSYIVGLNTDPELKEIACSSGGQYYQIQTMGNVLDGVLKYQKVLSKPIGKIGTDYVTFTPLYLDGSGLGMMTTVSTGVFIPNNNTMKNELIGVAGLDIVVSLLQQQYPIESLGVFGHAFAINNNGLFLMHPRFKDQSGYLPDPATVYLDEVENTIDVDVAKDLSKKMINGEIGCLEAEADWLFPKETMTRIVRLNNTYCYRPLPDTPFFAGTSIPAQNKVKMTVNKNKISSYFKSGVDALVSNIPNQTHEIASWLFCDIPTTGLKLQPVSTKYYLTANDLYSYLKPKSNLNETKCDFDLLSNLLHSASTIHNFTKEHWFSKKLVEQKVSDVYIITASGFIAILSQDPRKSTTLQRQIFEEQKFAHPASHFNKHSKEYNIFTVDIKRGKPLPKPERRKSKRKTISIGRAIYPPNDRNNILYVVGMTTYSDVLATWINETFHDDCQINKTNECYIFNCKETEKYQCYLIDENGYVVSSNQGNYQSGHFIGYFNGRLVSKLTDEMGIFHKKVWRDTQADCPRRTLDSLSSAIRLESLYGALFESVTSIVHGILNFVIWFMVSISLTIKTQNQVHATSPKNVSCTKDIPLFVLQNQAIDASGSLPCLRECNQYFKIKNIPQTNLAFIVTSNNCSNGINCPLVIEHNEPIRVEERNICEQRTNYRQPPQKCFKSTGLDTECTFEYTNTDKNLFIFLIVGFSVCFAMIVIVVTILPYCRRLLFC